MSKSRPFSIYLLKPAYDATNALKDAHRLDSSFEADALPPGAKLFILDNPATEVWWTGYFGVHAKLQQVTKGAIVFFPIGERWFALSFGHVHQNLRDESFEHDFGLRVTLNCVDPKKLRSTDTLQPGEARRRRTQSPIGEDLTYFDFDRNSSVLRSLTGKVANEYQHFFKDASGASSLSIKSSASPGDLASLAETLLALYQSEKYRLTFPDIQNIIPVSEPSDLAQLSDALMEAVRSKAEGLYLTIPEIVDYQKDAYYALFSGAGRSKLYADVFLAKYYEYLEENGVDFRQIATGELQSHALNLVDQDENQKERFSIFRCLLFETSLGRESETFHLIEGKWYRVENNYLKKLRDTLDPLCTALHLPAYSHDGEGEYNLAVCQAESGLICLDETNISPTGQSQVEPCDLLGIQNETAVFYHIKRSTHSAELSHLFNQGVNAIELLKVEPESLERLMELIKSSAATNETGNYYKAVVDQHFAVVFGIVTHKPPDARSSNLPLFSRISLMRAVRALKVAGTTCSFGFIQNHVGSREGIPRKRKQRVLVTADSAETIAAD
jgi:uncharacterized protein (TIGR04141 family)